MSRGFSPLERRILLALVSLIRDRSDPGFENDDDFWLAKDVKLAELYDALYVPGNRSWSIERRNQRQAQRRALARLQEQGYVSVLALAWVNIEDWCVIRWQGGARRKPDRHGHRDDTPTWRLVTLTDVGIKAALLLEQAQVGAS